MKAAAVQNNIGDLKSLKKKLKMKNKKMRLKEEVRLWEESRRCPDGRSDEPEAAEPPSKQSATENDKISKQSTGEKRAVFSFDKPTIPLFIYHSYSLKISVHHCSLSIFPLT